MKNILNEVRRLQEIAGILKEDRFYAPTYLLQVLGSQEAVDKLIKQFEEDHASVDDPEGDNARDYLLSIDNPGELMDVVKDYIDLSEMELGLKPDQLEEDDYDMGISSGDTDAMNIAEDELDLSDTPKLEPNPNWDRVEIGPEDEGSYGNEIVALYRLPQDLYNGFWDAYISIEKTPERKYYVHFFDGDIHEDMKKQYDTLREAEQAALQLMDDIVESSNDDTGRYEYD